MHSPSVVVRGSSLTKAHTAALKKKLKKKLFPPQSEECLSVVSTLPWKHMVWFRCFGCMRGELQEKSYDHKRPNRWSNMWVSGRCCPPIRLIKSLTKSTVLLTMLLTSSFKKPWKHTRHIQYTHVYSVLVYYMYCRVIDSTVCDPRH